jgi:phosphoglycerate dehydrogenase-like enzyme
MIAAIGVLSCLAASGFASNFQRRNWLPSHGTLRTANYVKKTTPASTRNGFMKVAGVFTEEPLPDTLVEQMPNLKWLHMTRGGVNSYLTPTVKARPIQVTGSKGIHGTVFSEFALACIFALAKKLPECMEAQKQKKWQKLTPVEIEGKTLGHGRTRHRRGSVGAQGESVGSASYRDETDATSKPEYVDELGTPEFLPQLLSESDFVVLLLASIPSTVNILGAKELRSMKTSAYLINSQVAKR